MLQIRMMKVEDTNRAKTLFRENPRIFNQMKIIVPQTFIAEENGKIVGIVSYKKKEQKMAVVDCLYVSVKERGMKLGDGLLRAVLNHMTHEKIKTVFINSTTESNGFFMAECLEVASNDPNDSDRLTFIVHLPDFFENGCKSSRGQA